MSTPVPTQSAAAGPGAIDFASYLKLMSQHGLNAKASQIKPEEIADWSYCKRFEESGFFRSLY